MTLPNPKELKKLADTCRKAGIKHFRCEGFEFTLTDEVPVSNYKKKQSKTTQPQYAQGDIEIAGPTQEELLFWSSGGEEAPEEKILAQ